MKSRMRLLEISVVTLTLFILLWVMVPKFLTSQNINLPRFFPDPALRQAVEKALGVPEDEKFTREQAASYDGDLRLVNVTNLKGLEYLPNVTRLQLFSSKATKYDFSIMPNLERLDVGGSELERLELSQNAALYYLNLTLGSPFATKEVPFEIEIPTENNITDLYIGYYSNMKVNFSNFPNLHLISVQNFSMGSAPTLHSIDVSKNPDLQALRVSDNRLTELNLSKNPLLSRLECANNLIECITFAETTKLEKIDAGGNQLEELDLSHSDRLYWIDLYNNPIRNIKLPHNRQLKEIRLDDVLLTDEAKAHIEAVGVRIINRKL